MIPEGNPNLLDSLPRSWSMSVMFSSESANTTNQGLGAAQIPKGLRLKSQILSCSTEKLQGDRLVTGWGVFGDSLWSTWAQHFNIFRGSRRSLAAVSRSANKSQVRTSLWSTWLQHFSICRGSRRSLAVVSRSANKSRPRTSSWPTCLRDSDIFHSSGRSSAVVGRSATKSRPRTSSWPTWLRRQWKEFGDSGPIRGRIPRFLPWGVRWGQYSPGLLQSF